MRHSSSPHAINVIRQYYGHLFDQGDDIQSIHLISTGWVNRNIEISIGASATHEAQHELLKNTKKYVLRCVPREKCQDMFSSEIKRENLEFEMRVLSCLESLPVARPVKNQYNDFICQFSMTHEDEIAEYFAFAVLFQFEAGSHHVNDREEWEVIAMGSFLGDMHRITSGCLANGSLSPIPEHKNNTIDIEYIRSTLQSFVERNFVEEQPVIGPICSNLKRFFDIAFPLSSSSSMMEELANSDELPRAVAHSDLHDENVLLHREQKQLGCVLDSDECTVDYQVSDLAQSVFLWCFVACKSQVYTHFSQLFIRKYEEHRQQALSPLEKRVLRRFMFWNNFVQCVFLLEETNAQTTEQHQLRVQYLTEYLQWMEREISFIDHSM